MAGDWIKMRTDLYRDPKVCVMADLLMDEDSELSRYVNHQMQRDITVTRNVIRNVTVGALVSVWGVLRHRGKRVDNDLVIKRCTLSVIDDLADLPGFGNAMAYVGWVEENDQGLVLPRFFDEFNVDPGADSKAKNAERQRRYREKNKAKSNENSNVTVTSQSDYREEKNRVEKSINNADVVFNNNAQEKIDDSKNENNKPVEPEKQNTNQAEFDVTRFAPSDSEIKYCERLELDDTLDLLTAQFRIYHSEQGTTRNAGNWSRLYLGWINRHVIPPIANPVTLRSVTTVTHQ